MKRWLIATSLLAVAGCQSIAAPGEHVAGTATLHVHVIAEPKVGAPRADPTISSFDTPTARTTGEFTTVDYADLSQIVVWVEPVNGVSSQQLTAAPLLLDLRDPSPPDSVTAVASVGQRLSLKNATGSPQTIYSVSDGNDFNLGTIAPGASGEAVVRVPGTIEILGDSSEKPLAAIEAAPSPWVKLAHAGDDLMFSNLPPGAYRVVSWHPRLPGSQTSVDLVADQSADAQIRVGVNALPKVGPTQTP
jgi:hypothetical protein